MHSQDLFFLLQEKAYNPNPISFGIMLTIMQSAGCCAVPKLGRSYNSTRQDGPLRQVYVRGSAHLNDLPSKFWGVSVRICEIQKDGDQLSFRSRDVVRASQKMFVPGI